MTENPKTGNNAGMAREDDVEGLDVFPSIPSPIAPASGLYTYSNVFTLPLPPVPVPYPVVPPGPIPPRPGGLAREEAEWSGAEWDDSSNAVVAMPIFPLFQQGGSAVGRGRQLSADDRERHRLLPFDGP